MATYGKCIERANFMSINGHWRSMYHSYALPWRVGTGLHVQDSSKLKHGVNFKSSAKGSFFVNINQVFFETKGYLCNGHLELS